MLLRAGEPPTTDVGKWQSFSIRNVLGDALQDDEDGDSEEDSDVVVERAAAPVDRLTGVGGCDGGCGGEDVASGLDQGSAVDDVHVTAWDSSSSSHCSDQANDFHRWAAFHAASNVIITSSQHSAALDNRYSSHGISHYFILTM